ncbi:FeoB-associated Cys-rich membrane protein [Moheibacter stercoris]|uniref:Virus attachment protein p12 family protein n=1 Tax=Moheibacter stercoris TaxID=1628251 RepID=A0ABV2LZ45_9FLAO
MFWIIAQYLFIGIVFIIAMWYIFNMFKDSFGKKKGSSCAKGCGCDDTSSPEKK